MMPHIRRLSARHHACYILAPRGIHTDMCVTPRFAQDDRYLRAIELIVWVRLDETHRHGQGKPGRVDRRKPARRLLTTRKRRRRSSPDRRTRPYPIRRLREPTTRNTVWWRMFIRRT